MAAKSLDPSLLARAVAAVAEHGSVRAAAKALGIPRPTFDHQYREAQRRNITKDFHIAVLPSAKEPTSTLIARRCAVYERKAVASDARKLIPVKVTLDGPVGLAIFGDPHTDDDGCNWPLLKAHAQLVRRTPGLFAANVADLRNNWIGRLMRLWASQSTSAVEAWQLTEWLVREIPWLLISKGNHDAWSGHEDKLETLCEELGILYEPTVRAALTFPNGRQVRLNARHDFKGRSMWNTAHGPSRAAQLGWRDHLLVCGHTHVSGYQVLKDPMNGLVSHALRIASYKLIDRYAVEQGLPDQSIFICPVVIIRPEFADNDPRLLTVFFDPEAGADYLKFLRKRKAA